MSSRSPRVAVLGAGGLVGRVVHEGLRQDFDVVALDRRGQRAQGVRRLDARRLRPLTRALRGCDAVVDLAAAARADTPWETVYSTNLRIVPTVLEAARRAGVPRVVLASSNHTMTGYEQDEPWASVLAGRYGDLDPQRLPRLSVEEPVRPRSAYGASKVFGEAACEWYAGTYGLQTTCLRIGTVLHPDRPRTPRHLATWLSHRDLVALVVAALRCPPDQLPRVVWAVSANTWRVWDTEPTVPGFVARDDADAFRAEVLGAAAGGVLRGEGSGG